MGGQRGDDFDDVAAEGDEEVLEAELVDGGVDEDDGGGEDGGEEVFGAREGGCWCEEGDLAETGWVGVWGALGGGHN